MACLSRSTVESSAVTVRTAGVCIHLDSGGKVNISGGDSIGHCETNSSSEHMSNSEWFLK